jgi:hypothetical protein
MTMSAVVRCGALVLALAGCGADQLELTLDIRESGDRLLFASVEELHLRAERDGKTLVEQIYPPTVNAVSVRGVPYGNGIRTTFTLEGTTAGGDVVARGSTCPVDFEAPGTGGALRASLYFAPTKSFAPTVGPPLSARSAPIALALPTGDLLLSGGRVGDAVVSGSEVFSVASSRFVASAATLTIPREGAEAVQVGDIGALITGGNTTDGNGVSTSEVFRAATGLYSGFDNAALGPRTGHRAVPLPDGRVLITGGSQMVGDAPLDTSVFISLQPDGSATVAGGPTMVEARRNHAAVVAAGVAVLIGGYGLDGKPLAAIEALSLPTSTSPVFVAVSTLRTPRAEATATVLQDGTILVVGGSGDATGKPLLDAEVFNPFTHDTEVKQLAIARRGHTATALPDGRVLIVGGIGIDGNPTSSVELFIPTVGFVSEHSLGTPRAGHRALSLCDGTVLVVGGGEGAELYVPPPA